MKNIKRFAYAVVIATFSTFVHAGSYEDFFVAIRNDNASQLEGLLQRGFDPNTRDPKGQPGLTMAMQERSPKAARVLLGQRSIDVNALNQAGESALMLAALKGDLPSVQLLAQRGASINQPGWSPLHYAATGPEPKVVAWLLEQGAAIDAESPNGTTPLMMAAQYGDEASVRLLVERGADPAKRNQKGLRAVDFARLSGRAALVSKLEQITR